MQHDRGEDHAGDAHEFFAEDQGEQGEPHGIFDPVTNDLAVQEVLQLVDHDEEDECHQGHAWGNGEGDADDERVAHDIADNGQKAAEKGQGDQDGDVRELVPDQEDRSQRRVDG